MKKTLFAIVSISGAASLVLTYAFASHPRIILISLVLLTVVLLAALQSREYVLRYLAAFLLLPILFDIPGTHFGLWSFRTPDFLGFPFWLPFLYGNISVTGHYLARTVRLK